MRLVTTGTDLVITIDDVTGTVDSEGSTTNMTIKADSQTLLSKISQIQLWKTNMRTTSSLQILLALNANTIKKEVRHRRTN
ncbi:Uncharacterised protein [Streptococcus pyogenes]|nr:Uncharacterised protein [Streptococcus pyogenes]VGV60965.1 Uncharacterised protein [Streptococcus pyogenes]VGW10443.1 Uncharacterised protein [Streptococcus pyogenes]VHC07995.1 Uncharacterised protein [Streptococcus pyogenes]VHC60676.1 Uncharacterised protein [Streptococcus pyogenes]